MKETLLHPFSLGLGLGLLFTTFVLIFAIHIWLNYRAKIKQLQGENQRLREHINTHLEITAKGNEELKKELDELKKQNENLRISVTTWQQKPDKTQLKMLYIYDKAISIMNTKFPGFALSWESAFKEAQEEIKQLDSGIKAWMRKVFKPSAELPLSLSHSQDAIDETQNEYETNENFSSQSTND